MTFRDFLLAKHWSVPSRTFYHCSILRAYWNLKLRMSLIFLILINVSYRVWNGGNTLHQMQDQYLRMYWKPQKISIDGSLYPHKIIEALLIFWYEWNSIVMILSRNRNTQFQEFCKFNLYYNCIWELQTGSMSQHGISGKHRGKPGMKSFSISTSSFLVIINFMILLHCHGYFFHSKEYFSSSKASHLSPAYSSDSRQLSSDSQKISEKHQCWHWFPISARD